MIARIRKGNDFKHTWTITWNGQPEDFSDATDITLTTKVYGQVKTLIEGVDYHIDGGNVVVDFTPAICDITGTYTVELNYIKPSAEFIDGDRRSAVDVQAFQIVNTSAEANATEGVSLSSEALAIYALKYEDLSPENIAELQRPATEAAESIGELEQTIEGNEAIRQSNESDRQTNTLTAIQNANTAADNANEMSSHPPVIIDDYWHNWNFTTNQYETTGQYARGDSAIEGSLVLQTTGQSAVDVMSQKAVTDEIAQLAGDVSVKMANIFTNGDFSNGLTGWDTSISGTTYAIESGILTATLVADGDSIMIVRAQPGETPPNSVMYTRYRVRVMQAGATSISANYGATVNDVISSPNVNQWYDAIDRFTTGSSASIRSGVRVYYQTGQALTGYAVEVDYGMQINLTQIFGSGNEPTKEEMDLLISILGIEYFEGIITIPAQKVMQWQLKLTQNADDAREAIQSDLALKANHGYESNPKTLKEVDDKIDEVVLTTVPIDAIGGETITPETNLLASLVGTDIEDINIWGSGFFRSSGSIEPAASICYSKDYIRASKGSYNAWIAISSTYSIVIYDKEKNIIGSVQNDSIPTAYQFSFDLPERTAYIRISHAKSQSTNKLKLYPVDVIYGFDNSIFELKGEDVIEVGTNFLSELINSELTDTDIWGSGYLLSSGQIRESATGYYSKKYYKVAGGSYNLRAYISGGAACLVYDGGFNVISSFTTDVSPFDEPIIIPDNAVYIRISHISAQYNVRNIKLTNTIPVVFQNNKILSNISKGSYDYAVNGEAVASHELEMIKRANPPKKMFPIVSFISDDGHIANIDWYVPILEDHDVKSTFVIISGRDHVDYMTPEQIKDLHNKGHEIGGHTKSHLHLADIPIEEAEEEIRHSALFLIDMGIEPYTFVHPFGSRNLDTDRLAREHFKISPIVTIDSTVADGTCCNTPPIDTYGVKRLSFDSFQTYESRLQLAKDAVDVAVSNNQWLIFIIHPQYPEYNTANPDYLSKRQDVSDLISYIKQQGARVLTCKDAMRYYGNSFEVGNKRLDDIYYALGSDGNDEGNFFDRRI